MAKAGINEPRTIVRQALADGKWHTVSDLIRTHAKKIPPGMALRRYGISPGDTRTFEAKLAVAQPGCIRAVLSAMVVEDIIEAKGPRRSDGTFGFARHGCHIQVRLVDARRRISLPTLSAWLGRADGWTSESVSRGDSPPTHEHRGVRYALVKDVEAWAAYSAERRLWYGDARQQFAPVIRFVPYHSGLEAALHTERLEWVWGDDGKPLRRPAAEPYGLDVTDRPLGTVMRCVPYTRDTDALYDYEAHDWARREDGTLFTRRTRSPRGPRLQDIPAGEQEPDEPEDDAALYLLDDDLPDGDDSGGPFPGATSSGRPPPCQW